MKNRKNNKKGFTIVELVIVIGVIGILSAILIPTFANLTTQAQEAARKEELQNAYTAYVIDGSDDTPFETIFGTSEIAFKSTKTGETDKYYVYGDKGWNPAAQSSDVAKGSAIGTYNGYEAYERA